MAWRKRTTAKNTAKIKELKIMGVPPGAPSDGCGIAEPGCGGFSAAQFNGAWSAFAWRAF